jgi:peptidyl-prolyl cis-trans isomerase SurA
MTEHFRLSVCAVAFCAALAAMPSGLLAQTSAGSSARNGDYIVAVVNQEVITARELDQRVIKVRDATRRAGAQVPPPDELRDQVFNTMIEERAQMSYARELGLKIDEAEVDRAALNVATQNQISITELRKRLASEGMEFSRFRKNLRDQILLERVREREMQLRIKISDADIDAYLEKQRQKSGGKIEFNVAQILIAVPEGATDEVVNERRLRAEAALARIKAGESFEAVALEVSDDPSKVTGGAMGLRPLDRWPDAFAASVKDLQPGEVSPGVLRTGAGFHLIKLAERRDQSAFVVTQTHARHILLRSKPQFDQAAAVRRLAEFKRRILSGANSFEQLAQEYSEDPSGGKGGDLGWTSPGTFVPEFEEVMNQLPIRALSDPVVTRFGVHLIRVDERRQAALEGKQEREQARTLLREERYDQAFAEWSSELRAVAYVELREPPQ